jgi:hypothetical protein
VLTLFITSSCSFLNKKTFYKSVVSTEYGAAAYAEKNRKEYARLLKKIDGNMASILMTCQTENKTSSEIDCNSENSPKKENLTKMIKELQSQGFKTSLRVYVDLLDGQWRAYWDPKDKKQAFTQLKKILVKYAKYSERQSVDLFILGAEYEKLTRPEFKEQWVDIISSVRKSYKGLITYGANSNYSTYKKPEYQWIPFWSYLDFIGIDHYPSFDGQNPTKENLIKHHDKYINLYQSVQKDRPLYFNEVGFPSAKNGYKKPYQWIWDKNEENNFDQQSINISAFLEALKEKKVVGLSLWRYMPNESKVYPKGYNIEHPKAIKALKKGFQQL